MRLTECLLAFTAVACAQEAESGFELRATVSTEAGYAHELTAPPRDGSPFLVGLRSVLYPTWKLNKHWTISGAVQAQTRPYTFGEFNTQGSGIKTSILQAHLGYSRFWKNGSLVVRVGQLSSAFGSFLLRYDDKDNPLIGLPLSYGYYYQPITLYGLAGAQADVTQGKWDARAQLVNSSPTNRRSIFDRDQYANWAGGLGYTVRQGLRVGVSAYRGPYLDREFPYFFPGESPPIDLPATALGLDAQWGSGHWTVNGELQHFRMTYHVIPTYNQTVGYVEVRRVLHPRWYVATRLGFANQGEIYHEYEAVVGYRPNRRQLLKFGYDILHSSDDPGSSNRFMVQLVTVFRPLSIARD